MDEDKAGEAEHAAHSLVGLDLELRRHHYHSPEEENQHLDLIEAGVITNLEWDEKDGLWVQFDQVVTFDITPNRSSICVYADETPVVTLWAVERGSTMSWRPDWESELTHTERQRFLRRVSELADRATRGTQLATEALRTEAAALEQEERAEAADMVREWLGGR